MTAAAFDPCKTFVFCVGIDDVPWDEERKTIGDVGLARCFVNCAGVPPQRVVHVSDDEATKDAVERRFQAFLKTTTEKSTLVVYYGGHGKKDCLCTHKGKWTHASIIQSIERHFRGDRVFFLNDSCYSGNTYRSLSTISGRISYLLIMSTTPNHPAGDVHDEWCMTMCFVKAMERNITVKEMISEMADEHVRVKQDMMTSFVCGNADLFSPDGPMRLQDGTSNGGSPALEKAKLESPFKGLSSWKRGLASCKAGDCVYAKWHGGRPTTESPYVMPVWLPAVVTSAASPETVSVELHDPSISEKWTMTCRIDELLPELHFAREYLEWSECVPPLGTLAKELKYVTQELEPGTKLRVLWPEESRLYDATIISLKDYAPSWKRLVQVGPFVPVQWTEEETHSMVPRGWCFYAN